MKALPKTELTDRERRFIENVRMGMDTRPAMVAAGWAPETARKAKLERRPVVMEALAQVYREAREKAQVTRDEVLEGFKDAIGDAKLLGDPNAQIKGWTEIGKMCGFYAPQEHKVTLSAQGKTLEDQLSGLSTEELLELAGQDSLEVIEGHCERIE